MAINNEYQQQSTLMPLGFEYFELQSSKSEFLKFTLSRPMHQQSKLNKFIPFKLASKLRKVFGILL